MKKRIQKLGLLLGAVLLSAVGMAQTVTVSGDIKTMGPTGPLPGSNNDFVVFRLKNWQGNLPRVSGIGTINQLVYTVTPDASGHFSTTFYGNDQIIPANTTYIYEQWHDGKVQSSATYQFCTNSSCSQGAVAQCPCNVDNQLPLNPAAAQFLATVQQYVISFNGRSGIVIPASGDYTVAQVTGAAPSANPVFTGTFSAPNNVISPSTLSGVVNGNCLVGVAGVWTAGSCSGSTGVASFSGDSIFSNNVTSTGAVTLSIANAPAHSFWGNNGGGAATPGYTNTPSLVGLTINGGTVLSTTNRTGNGILVLQDSPNITTQLQIAGGTPITTSNATGSGNLVKQSSPALTGTPTAPTNGSSADASTQIATDAFVHNAINAFNGFVQTYDSQIGAPTCTPSCGTFSGTASISTPSSVILLAADTNTAAAEWTTDVGFGNTHDSTVDNPTVTMALLVNGTTACQAVTGGTPSCGGGALCRAFFHMRLKTITPGASGKMQAQCNVGIVGGNASGSFSGSTNTTGAQLTIDTTSNVTLTFQCTDSLDTHRCTFYDSLTEQVH